MFRFMAAQASVCVLSFFFTLFKIHGKPPSGHPCGHESAQKHGQHTTAAHGTPRPSRNQSPLTFEEDTFFLCKTFFYGSENMKFWENPEKAARSRRPVNPQLSRRL
jgi:hypothetical protein